MRRYTTTLPLLLLAATFVPAVWLPALAGSVTLDWDPVADPDVAGYKIYYGTSPGVYPSVKDVGNVTRATITGLSDCTRYYFAARAYDLSGNTSIDASNEVAGLGDPRINSLSPTSAERGQSLTVTVRGTNFDQGASLAFSDKINVYYTSYVSCTQVRGTVSIAGDALLGTNDAMITNPDGSRGTLAAALQVLPVSYPIVTSVMPAPGTLAVPVTVRPTVTFSERMNPSTILPSTLRLFAPNGTAVAQAAPPSLDTSGKIATIVPAASLAVGTVFRLQILGGTSGVRDAQGTMMLTTITYTAGFTTVGALANDAPAVASSTPTPDTAGVPITVEPAVTFTKSMDPGTITTELVALVTSDGTPVAQAPSSPVLDGSGTVATIVPAEPLQCSVTYSIRVAGGEGGVRDLQGLPLDAPFAQSPGFTTMAASDEEPPLVESVTPADEDEGVSTEVEPLVSFTEPMQPASLTPETVRLLDPESRPVQQLPGSPSLDRTGRIVRISPVEPLQFGTTYRVQVLGGAENGVRDLDGAALASDWIQDEGFLTLPPPSFGAPVVLSTDPEDGESDVPSDVLPSVTFSEPMDPTSISSDTIQLLDSDSNTVAQADGSPILEASGRIVTLLPAGGLQPGGVYRVVVRSGAEGVLNLDGEPMELPFVQAQGFSVERPDLQRPYIVSMIPEDGERNVSIQVRPSVTFNEPIDPASVSSMTVVLLREDGSAVAQADGSPALDGSGRMVRITPASPLDRRSIYRIQIVGGPDGIRDLPGNTLRESFTSYMGFETGFGQSDEGGGGRYDE